MTECGFTPTCGALLADGLSVRFRATGSSMEPAIRDGDVLTVEPAAANGFRRGDIVLYQSCGRVLVHRVRRVSGRGLALTCQGDNWWCSEEIVDRQAVLGKVVGVGPSDVVPAARSGLRREVGRLGSALVWVVRAVRRAVRIGQLDDLCNPRAPGGCLDVQESGTRCR